MTKKEVRRLGDSIRSCNYDVRNEEMIARLENYRLSFKDSIAFVYDKIDLYSNYISEKSITTYRIKRFESIVNKLDRHKKMQLDRMWDIAGCRCILTSNKMVYKLREKLYENLNIVKEYDYIKNPQESGYKSLHLFAKTNQNRVVEIQLRNQRSHNWATLVEITDLLYEDRIKEKRSHTVFREFHKLLAREHELSVSQKKRVLQILRKKRYIECLDSIFTKNYLRIREKWSKLDKTTDDFYLLTTSKDKIPKIESYADFDNAEENYFNKFKNNKNANIVLTHLPNATFDKISKAYSNYLLTYHEFTEYFMKLYEVLLIDYIKKNRIISFTNLYMQYSRLNIHNQINVIHEINFFLQSIEDYNKNIQSKKWISEIKGRLEKRRKKEITVLDEMYFYACKSIIPLFVYKIIINILTNFNEYIKIREFRGDLSNGN